MLLLLFLHSREGSYYGRDVGLLLHLPHSLSRAHAAFWKSFDLAASLELMLFLHWQPQFLDLEELRPGGLPGVDVIPPLAAAISRPGRASTWRPPWS